MSSKKIKLSDYSTSGPKDWDKEEVKQKTQEVLEEIKELQNIFYANASHSILVVLQALDAAGKDSLIKAVFSHLIPEGVQVKTFKAPTSEELSHDFLWRVHKETPLKKQIKIFNRSHYEDIIVQRVHNWIDDDIATKRIAAINHFEQTLVDNQTLILKFYLHISPEKQKEKLTDRLFNPRKMWKHNARDWEERKHWDQYMKYYESAINECNVLPWHIIPSDRKWVKNYIVACILRDALQSLNQEYPGLSPEDQTMAESIKKDME